MAKVDGLKIHIEGTNKLNELIVLCLVQIVPQVKPYIGKKIYLQSGKMSANFKIDIKKPETNPTEENRFLKIQNCNVYEKYNHLVFVFSICLNNGGGAVYFDREVWLGDINKDGVLSVDSRAESVEAIVKDYGFENRLDYDIEKAAILNYQAKKKEMEAARSKVKAHGFENEIYQE